MMGRILHALFAGAALWAAGLVFLLPLRRRGNFGLRAALFLPLLCALWFLSWQAEWVMWQVWALYFLCFLAVVGFALWCCDTPVSGAFYCGVWILASHQMALELCDAVMHWFGLARARQGVAAVLIFAVCCTVLAFTVARWMPVNGSYDIGPRQLSSSLFLLILFEVLFTLLVGEWTVPKAFYVGTILLAQFQCLTVLYLQNTLFKKSAMKQELDTLNILWHQQKDQYNLAKENIALINRKCHDLKHQVAAMRAMGNSAEREKYLEEIENSVEIYDSIVKTGSEALDTLLTEKSLYCEKEGIKINCVADGGSVSFVDPVDLYTILGNALDNAVESVERFAEADKRVIDVIIHARQGFLVINVINPLEGQLTFEEELPVTTKARNGYHGFGLKSIRHTAKKYGGVLSVDAGEGSFCLRVVIPLPEKRVGDG